MAEAQQGAQQELHSLHLPKYAPQSWGEDEVDVHMLMSNTAVKQAPPRGYLLCDDRGPYWDLLLPELNVWDVTEIVIKGLHQSSGEPDHRNLATHTKMSEARITMKTALQKQLSLDEALNYAGLQMEP